MADAVGVKNAARRKLEQELGIPPEDVPLDSFTWLTKVHYMGASLDGRKCRVADGVENGGVVREEPLWGEHEIDWILVCSPPTSPRLSPNPNEVSSVREFTQIELRQWIKGGVQVSPWFRVMEASGLVYKWWDAVLRNNLEGVLERDVIHRQQDLEAVAAGLAQGSLPPPLAFSACRDATHARGVTGPIPVT